MSVATEFQAAWPLSVELTTPRLIQAVTTSTARASTRIPVGLSPAW